MREKPKWIYITLIVLVFVTMTFPLIGIVALACIIVYLKKHGYLEEFKVKKPNIQIRPRTNLKSPPQFLRKINILSDSEIRFENFTSVTFFDENGSHKMLTYAGGKISKVFMRLNQDQFDVFVQNDQRSHQLSFEKENIKVLDITNNVISVIEGNTDNSYLEIHYESVGFTDLEVNELITFFSDFHIQNKAVFTQEPVKEAKVKEPKVKKKLNVKMLLIPVGIICLVIGGSIVFRNNFEKPSNTGTSISGTYTKYLSGLTYSVNQSLKEDSWISDEEIVYHLGKNDIPYVSVANEVDHKDYTQIYDYSTATMNSLEDYVWDEYFFDYGVSKKQHDYMNLENGKWYHFSGLMEADNFYRVSTSKDVFTDFYVMPTQNSLVIVLVGRDYDDTNDYDVREFLESFDFSELGIIFA